MKWWTLGLAAAVLVFLAGCSPDSMAVPPTQTLASSTETPRPSPIATTATPPLPGPADVATSLAEPVIPAQAAALVGMVIEDLAGALNVSPDQVRLREIEEVVWPDDNLGCEPDEMQTADEDGVAGYRITLEHLDDIYEYHTDAQNQFRPCRSDDVGLASEPVILDPILNSLGELARQHLAEQLDLPLRRVFLVDVTPYQWPDNSLGCPQSQQEYAPTPVLGYRIVLRVGRQNYYYHSNYRQVIPCPEDAEVLPEANITSTPAEPTEEPTSS